MNKKILPKLRFAEFKYNSEWKVAQLEVLADRIISRNKDNSEHRVFTNSAVDGVVEQSKYFEREIVNQNNLDNYFITELNDYVYNPRVSSNAPVGPISKNKIGRGIMSPLYTLFRFKNNKNDFYEYFFKTHLWHKYIKKVANTGARYDRISITTDDFMKMPLPVNTNEQEQQKIADCLSSLDELIEAENKKLEALQKHKKGLMQKLFPADGSSVPEWRFPEFKENKPWKETQLGKLCNITTGKLDANAMVENGKYRFYTCAKEFFLIDNYAFDTEALLISGNGANVGYIHYYKGKFNAYQRTYVLDQFTENVHYIKCFLDNNLTQRISYEKNEGNTPYIVLSTLTDMNVLLPTNPNEQQKIADCLSQTDNLILSQSQKIDKLKEHKKGLMQGLFPSIEEMYK